MGKRKKQSWKTYLKEQNETDKKYNRKHGEAEYGTNWDNAGDSRYRWRNLRTETHVHPNSPNQDIASKQPYPKHIIGLTKDHQENIDKAIGDLISWHRRTRSINSLEVHEVLKGFLVVYFKDGLPEHKLKINGRMCRVDMLDKVAKIAVEIDNFRNEKSLKKLHGLSHARGYAPVWILATTRGKGGGAHKIARTYGIPIVTIHCRHQWSKILRPWKEIEHVEY